MNPIPLSKWLGDIAHPLVIAGPCSAESEAQVLNIAHQVKKIDQVKIFRAGIWKPRTRPGSFEGVGDVGLPWLQKVKQETGLLTTTEVANARHVEAALKHDIDILWIGARTSANPFSVQEIADALRGTGIPVMVKNPINADLSLWIGALERFAAIGINKLAAIHRGFSTGAKSNYRNPPVWKLPIELKRRFPDLPLICDPSHIAGSRDLIEKVCQKAMDIDMSGLMVETHHDPSIALSDAAQQVTPESLNNIVQSLVIRSSHSDDVNFEHILDELRGEIDRIDQELLDALKLRMNIVGQIGQVKMENKVTALQVNRLDTLIKQREQAAKNLGLSGEFAKEFFGLIHDYAVKIQTDLMNKEKQK